MLKIILPTELADKVEPLLPQDITSIRVNPEGEFDGDISGAEVYFNGFKLKNTTLHKVLAAAPKIR